MPFCFISCYLHNFPTNHWRDNYRNSNRSPHVSCSGCKCGTSPSPAPESRAVTIGDTWAADCSLLGCWAIISLPFHSFRDQEQSAAQQLSSVLLSSRESGEEPGSRPPLQQAFNYSVLSVGTGLLLLLTRSPTQLPTNHRPPSPSRPPIGWRGAAGAAGGGTAVWWRRTRPPVAGLGWAAAQCAEWSSGDRSGSVANIVRRL